MQKAKWICFASFLLVTSATTLLAEDLLESYLFQEFRTNAFLVWQQNQLRIATYRPGFTRNSKHLLWSVSKSYTNGLIGHAVLKGRINLDQPLQEYLPQIKSAKMTLRHALEFSTCLDWRETYEHGNLLTSSVLHMLYRKGLQNMAGFVAAHDLVCEPGSRFSYSSGDTNLLGGVLAKAFPDLDEDLLKPFFKGIGMKRTTFERDTSGGLIAAANAYSTAEDLLTFGKLYLNDGVVEGKRYLPEGWVAYTKSPAKAYSQTYPLRRHHWVGGPSFWNQTLEDGSVAWTKLPPDAFAALGHWGQLLLIIPSKQMILARLGDDRHEQFDVEKLYELTLRKLGEQSH